jgi:TolA-binding protein
MKKIFTLILLVSILVSCSDWKYSNGVKRQKRTYVYSNPKSTTESEISSENEKAVSVIDEEITPKNQKLESLESEIESQPETTENNEAQIILVKTKKLENDEDSVKPVSQSMVDEALDAENEGKKSRNLGIAGFILQFIPFLGIIGLILAAVALSKGTKSLKANYNTPRGIDMARVGVIFSSISIALYILRILIVVLLILALV